MRYDGAFVQVESEMDWTADLKKQHHELLQHPPELSLGKVRVKERVATDAYRRCRRYRSWDELASQLRLQMLVRP